MKNLHNPHPGEILLAEFMEPYRLTNYRLAKDLDIPESRIGKIVKGERRITADTALRLEMYFGLDASFWLGLQNDYDLLEEKRAKEKQPLLIKLYEFINDKTAVSITRKNSTIRHSRGQHKKVTSKRVHLKH
jgi:addiction module HigA family antidote